MKATCQPPQRRFEGGRAAFHPASGRPRQQYDTQQTAARDRTLIVPVVLGIILLILVLLLRSLLVPVLLVATVALNFLATLGVSAVVFEHRLGFSGTDASVPLYGFVFLAALGVDYNIFLMSRVREEALAHGNRQGVLRGLTTTGGVIASAGVVLAATFAALMVIPLAFMVQIAFIVAFGVLLDTLVVRSLLVPALVLDIGARVWWPSNLGVQGPGHRACREAASVGMTAGHLPSRRSEAAVRRQVRCGRTARTAATSCRPWSGPGASPAPAIRPRGGRGRCRQGPPLPRRGGRAGARVRDRRPQLPGIAW